MKSNKKRNKYSFRSNILTLFFSFSMLLFLPLLHHSLSADKNAENLPDIPLPSREKSGSGTSDSTTQAINSILSCLIMETKLFDSVEAAANLVLNPEFSMQSDRSFSAPAGREEGYLKNRLETGFSAPFTEREEGHSSFSPDEIRSVQIIPPGMVIPGQSSLAVIATVKKVYQEQLLKETGELQNISFSKLMQQNSRPKQLPTDPGWYEILSGATGIPPENILFSIYEIPVFQPLPKPENPAAALFQSFYLPLLFLFLGILFLEPILIVRKAGKNKQMRKQALLAAKQKAKEPPFSKAPNTTTKMPSAPRPQKKLQPSEDERLKKIKKLIDSNPEAASDALKDYMKR